MNTLQHVQPPSGAARGCYDHRIRAAICNANDPTVLDSCIAIPRSTARSWLRRGQSRVVTLDEGDFEVAELRIQIAMLEGRVCKYSEATRNLAAVVRLQRAELDASGFSLANQRIPGTNAKTLILEAVFASARAMRSSTSGVIRRVLAQLK